MNQVTNLVQWKNLLQEQKDAYDWNCKYEWQGSGEDWYSDDGDLDSNAVYRLVIEPGKFYYIKTDFNTSGIELGKTLLDQEDAGDATFLLEEYKVIRPATEAEIPEPEPATLEERVKSEYGEYDVVMLGWSASNILDMVNKHLPHIMAQSMRGFHKYVYDIGGVLCLDRSPVKAIHPCAVLFARVEG